MYRKTPNQIYIPINFGHVALCFIRDPGGIEQECGARDFVKLSERLQRVGETLFPRFDVLCVCAAEAVE